MIYTDPDGDWVQYVIGAAIGGFTGWKIAKANGEKGWAMFGYIAAGAGIGAVTAGIGDKVLGAIFATSVSGSASLTATITAYSVSGASAGVFSGGSFAALSGGNIWKGALMGGVAGAAGGALGGYMKHDLYQNAFYGKGAILGCNDCASVIYLNEVVVKGQNWLANVGTVTGMTWNWFKGG